MPFRRKCVSTGRKVILRVWNCTVLFCFCFFLPCLWGYCSLVIWLSTILTRLVGFVSYSSSGVLNYVWVVWIHRVKRKQNLYRYLPVLVNQSFSFCVRSPSTSENMRIMQSGLELPGEHHIANQTNTEPATLYTTLLMSLFLSHNIEATCLCSVRYEVKLGRPWLHHSQCRAVTVLACKKMGKDLSRNVTYLFT